MEITPTTKKSPIAKAAFIFVLCFISALGLTILIKEPEFNASKLYVLFLLFFSIGLWFNEVIPPFAVGLFIIAFLSFALGNPCLNDSPMKIDVYVNTFSSSVIWLMLGGFF